MGKHAKTPPKPRPKPKAKTKNGKTPSPKPRKPGFWKSIKIHFKAKLAKVTAPVESHRASQNWVDGENLTPRIQPYPWRHYVAPEDLEVYAAVIGGYEFQFELLPESGADLRKAAYDAAEGHWGPFVDSQPLDEIRAVSAPALVVLPEPIRG
jgi:hypothetical protein